MVLDNVMRLLRSVLARLDDGGIAYMVVGSVGSIVYGEPRMTKDMDLVVNLVASDARRIEAMFPFDDFYCPPAEVLRHEIVQRGQFNLIHHDTGLKIDLIIRKSSPHALEEFARRRKVTLWEGFDAYVASPEDIVVKKLDYFREGGSQKHLDDIRGILATTPLEMDYLLPWVDRLGLRALWNQVALEESPGDLAPE